MRARDSVSIMSAYAACGQCGGADSQNTESPPALGYHVIHVGWKRCMGNVNIVVDVVTTVDLDVLVCSDGIHN